MYLPRQPAPSSGTVAASPPAVAPICRRRLRESAVPAAVFASRLVSCRVFVSWRVFKGVGEESDAAPELGLGPGEDLLRQWLAGRRARSGAVRASRLGAQDRPGRRPGRPFDGVVAHPGRIEAAQVAAQ